MRIEAIDDCIVIPNSMLPESFHDKLRGGRTISSLNKMCDKRDGTGSEFRRIKAIKARNVARLAAQFNGRDIDRPLDYSNNEINELQLVKNQIAMLQGMINGGLIDADDLLDNDSE